MDPGSDHSKSDSDDDEIRYELNPAVGEGTTGDARDQSPAKASGGARRRPRAGRKNVSHMSEKVKDPKWIFPSSREEALTEEDEEFHDSVQGHPSDVEDDPEVDFPLISAERRRRGDPSNASWEPGDYRDARAPKTGPERRRGPHSINIECKDGPLSSQQTARAAAGQSSFSSVTYFMDGPIVSLPSVV